MTNNKTGDIISPSTRKRGDYVEDEIKADLKEMYETAKKLRPDLVKLLNFGAKTLLASQENKKCSSNKDKSGK